MRKYSLVSPKSREKIDLRDYQEVIINAVHQILPTAEVWVEQTFYCVSPEPNQGDAVKIGRLICQSELRKQCIHISKLFYSIHVDNPEEKHAERDTKTLGRY